MQRKVSRVYFLRGDVKFSNSPDHLSFKFFDRNLEILLQFYLIYRRIFGYSYLKNWKNVEIGDVKFLSEYVYKIFLIFILERISSTIFILNE